MFISRLISGIVMLIIAFSTIRLNGLALIATLLMLSLIGLSELYKIEKIAFKGIGILGYVITAVYYVVLYFLGFSLMSLILIIPYFLIISIDFVIKYPRLELKEIMLSFFGFIYVSVMLSFVYILRNTPAGYISVWLIFIGAWGADTCAYCVGMLIGKKKLAPILSPKKSVEGAVGGVLGSCLLAYIYALVMSNYNYVDNKMIYIYPVVCFFASIISIFGDLFASAIKRKYNIKDYGNFIPGHGGVLDRFDSIIFVAPVITLIIKLFDVLSKYKF